MFYNQTDKCDFYNRLVTITDVCQGIKEATDQEFTSFCCPSAEALHWCSSCNKYIVMLVGTFGLYSAFLAWRAINFRSNGHPRLTVETMFLHQISCEYHILYLSNIE